MKYRAFGDFTKGYSHEKNGSEAEDYAVSYNDPQGRYYIGAICDGHSDKNCFRSGKGAQFGCESAVEILQRFFNLYFAQKPEKRKLPEEFENRLKRSLKLCWNEKVKKDILENPIKEEELRPLSERVRKIYEDNRGLLNIYGATFLAICVCEDFFLAIQVGDGVILCIDENGLYYCPVPKDEKSDTGAPASLCDSDLFVRENAFRIVVSDKLPQIATASSDGIEDCMDSMGYKKFTFSLLRKIESYENEDQSSIELNETQKKYLKKCLEYYAGKGIGAEDDCSLAIIYDLNHSAPEIKIPRDEALKIIESLDNERAEMVKDYERRIQMQIEKIKILRNSEDFKKISNMNIEQWMEAHEKFESQKQILKTTVKNRNEKINSYNQSIKLYLKYAEDSDSIKGVKALQTKDIDDIFTESDNDFMELNRIWQIYLQKESLLDELKSKDKAVDEDSLEEALKERNSALETFSQRYKDYIADSRRNDSRDHRMKRDSIFDIWHNL